MQVFAPFSSIPDSYTIMYPDGQMKKKSEVIKDYPILGTALGVIGFQTDSSGTVSDPVLMGYYDNLNSAVDAYVSQGAEVTDDMTPAQKCAAITEFVNNPINDDEDALDTYLSM